MTFGFDSAVACVADALDRLHYTAISHSRVMVLEVMGRHAVAPVIDWPIVAGQAIGQS